MNIYKALNEMIEEIEKKLDTRIDYNTLAKTLGVNKTVAERLFGLLCGVTLKDYIRKRRLSCAGVDLVNSNLRVIDIAYKYQYNNPTSFSRAFYKFHEIHPKDARKNKKGLKNFPKLHFQENRVSNTNISYDITEKEPFTLYGVGKKTDIEHIAIDAPTFFEEMTKKYKDKYGEIPYAMVSYKDRDSSDDYEYWILYNRKIEEFKPIHFPKSKWLVFHIPSCKAKEIQKVSQQFYNEFLPSVRYRLRKIPELEVYYEDKTDFLVPIE